jgi:tripartite-type tricarboxylate transporter receptor subunit TctC
LSLPRRAFLALALLAAPAIAHAQNAPPSRVTILVGFGPGQGNDQPARPDGASAVANRMSPDMSFDQSARFLARHLGRLLPGEPIVEARYAPGAAGLLAAATLARSPADGSVLALLSPNVVQASALGLAGGRFDARRFAWIGGLTSEEWACVSVRGKKEAGQGLFVGSLGAGSRSDVHGRAFAGALSPPLKVIPGYSNRGELARALESGEIDAACGWPMRDLEMRRVDWLTSGRMEIAALMAGAASGDWVNAAGLDARPLLDALASESDFAWAVAAPPGLISQRLSALRAAFEGLIGDRAAVEDAARTGVALSPVPAEAILERVSALHALDGDKRAALLKLIAPP